MAFPQGPTNARAREEAREAFSPQAELERLISAVGQAGAVRLLGVGLPHVNKILAGKENISSELARRVLAVNCVTGVALQWFYSDEVVGWLLNSEPLLGGRNPMGVLIHDGAQPALQAIEARIAGSYA